ncbi:MAG: hypothetical protein OS112_00350 [Methanoregula sp.]|nr:MAG: hypothetical protein OS112_00350 [Methanoregula sp.]
MEPLLTTSFSLIILSIVAFPPLALQHQFARVVEEVERIREQQAESKKEIDTLFEGLMAGVFRGDSI